MTIKILENYMIELYDHKKYKVKKLYDVLKDRMVYVALNTENPKEMFYVKDLVVERVLKVYDVDGNIQHDYTLKVDPLFEDLLNIFKMKN